MELLNAGGDSLLMLAAYYGHDATVAALLHRGASPNAIGARGMTPLAGAIFHGYVGVVDALLAAGADLDAGHPSARATADMFERRDLIQGRR